MNFQERESRWGGESEMTILPGENEMKSQYPLCWKTTATPSFFSYFIYAFLLISKRKNPPRKLFQEVYIKDNALCSVNIRTLFCFLRQSFFLYKKYIQKTMISVASIRGLHSAFSINILSWPVHSSEKWDKLLKVPH